jgi:hypothetical protein
MIMRLKWIKVEPGFSYATLNSVRVAHVAHAFGGWNAFITEPKLSGVEAGKTEAATRANVRKRLMEHAAQNA